MFFNLLFVFFTDQTQQQELKPISEDHKQKQEEKIKLNTNSNFSSCSSQIQEANKPIL